MANYCIECNKELTSDEIALHKKMINRGATEHLCINCLAKFFKCDTSLLNKKIEQFKASGCMLFAKD